MVLCGEAQDSFFCFVLLEEGVSYVETSLLRECFVDSLSPLGVF